MMNYWPIRYSIMLVMGTLIATIPLQAETVDTLRTYNPNGQWVAYHSPQVVLQAARFDLPAPSLLHRLVLHLGGDSATGGALLRVFGNEAGAPFPALEQDLVAAIHVEKSKPGAERVVVEFREPVLLNGPQFFIALGRFSPGVTLLSDKHPRLPLCVSSAGSYHHQVMKTADGEWRSGIYGYAVEAVTERIEDNSSGYLVDATEQVGLADEHPATAIANRSIAVADFNGDDYLDLLAGGRLLMNRGGQTFDDVSEQTGIRGMPRANAVIDIDADGRPDILFLGVIGRDRSGAVLFRNEGGTFRRTLLDLPHIKRPSCFSIADVNGDGYEDIFIGQDGSIDGKPFPNLLLINNRAGGFSDATAQIYPDRNENRGSRGSQWIDVDNDGSPELFVVGTSPGAFELRSRTGKGDFVDLAAESASKAPNDDQMGGIVVGCAWGDVDEDGWPDLLLPRYWPAGTRDVRHRLPSAVHHGGEYGGGMPAGRSLSLIEYRERQAGGSWADVDNDGHTDLLLTTADGCNTAALYRRTAEGRFEEETYSYGLWRMPVGEDAVWADIDRDGRLDLVGFVEGALRYFRNNTPTVGNNWAEIDLTASTPGISVIGTRLLIYADGKTHTRRITAGRGLCMQEPSRVHVGLGNARNIDSVVVHYPGADGRRETFFNVAVNRLSRLVRNHGAEYAAATGLSITARPNPFEERLFLEFSLPVSGKVRLTIHTILGDRITTLIDDQEMEAGTHVVEWEPGKERTAAPSQGVYIYRITTATGEAAGRVTSVR